MDDLYRRIDEHVRESEPLKVLLLPDERREDNAPFFHARESGLLAKVRPRCFAAVQQPQHRPGYCPEDLQRRGGEARERRVDARKEMSDEKTVWTSRWRRNRGQARYSVLKTGTRTLSTVGAAAAKRRA